jgi:alginate O-acetyltransferase complex protein AlgI
MFPIDIDFSRLKEVLTYDPQAPMIFSSGIFLWLFAAFMIVYTLLQRTYSVCDAFLLLLLL